MKVVPGVPGSFTRAEWVAFAAWSALGLVFWLATPPRTRRPTFAAFTHGSRRLKRLLDEQRPAAAPPRISTSSLTTVFGTPLTW